jgi:hypothetical protein
MGMLMMKGLVRRALLTAVAVFAVTATQAHAATITFSSSDLGGGFWENNYVVSNATFNTFDGFSVVFDPSLYSDLSGESTANADWSLSVIQPDPLIPPPPGDFGFFNAIAQADGASTASPFSIQFKFLGTGAPGPQPFELLTVDAQGNILVLTPGGDTSPDVAAIPEPTSLLLFGTGAAALAKLRRRRGR